MLYTNTKKNDQTSIVVDLIVVNVYVSLSTLLETGFSVCDHLWTQDSPNCYLTFGGKTIPYIDQDSQNSGLEIFKTNQKFDDD